MKTYSVEEVSKIVFMALKIKREGSKTDILYSMGGEDVREGAELAQMAAHEIHPDMAVPFEVFRHCS